MTTSSRILLSALLLCLPACGKSQTKEAANVFGIGYNRQLDTYLSP